MSSNTDDVPRETDDAGIATPSNPAEPVAAVEQDVPDNPSPGHPSVPEDVRRPRSRLRIPLSEAARTFLQQLRPIKLTKLPVDDNGEAAISTVCYEPFEESELPNNQPVKTECNYIFCKGCLATWLSPGQGKRTCPTCRREFFEADMLRYPGVNDNTELSFIRAPELEQALLQADARFYMKRDYPQYFRLIVATLRTFDGRLASPSAIGYALYSVMHMFDALRRRGWRTDARRPDTTRYDNWCYEVLMPVLEQHRAPTVPRRYNVRESELRSPLAVELACRVRTYSGRTVIYLLDRALNERPPPPCYPFYLGGRPNLARLSRETRISAFLRMFGYAVTRRDVYHTADYWTWRFEQFAERQLALERQDIRRATMGGEDGSTDDEAEEDEPRICDMDFVHWVRYFVTLYVFQNFQALWRPT